MRIRDLIEALFSLNPETPSSSNPEVLIRDLDTGYVVPIESVKLVTLDSDQVFVIIQSVEYSDDRFPWDNAKYKTGSW